MERFRRWWRSASSSSSGPEGEPEAAAGEPEGDDPELPEDGVFEVPIEESLDLHLFLPREVGDAVEGYLEAAREKGFREVRLIHGKGKGVQRGRVRALLERSPHVERFEPAPGDRGAWGATLAWLKPREDEPGDPPREDGPRPDEEVGG